MGTKENGPNEQMAVPKWGIGRKEPYIKSVENTGNVLVFPSTVGKTVATGIADKFEIKGKSNIRKLIEEVVIPEGYTYIGEEAFANCSKLKKITLPSTITKIGKSAFSSCSGLESITIPGSVESIGEWSFAFCKALKNLEIDNGVLSIESYAFYECKKLTDVIIPDSMQTIRSGAFSTCTNLKNIQLPETVVLDGSEIFKECRKLADRSGFIAFHNIVYDYIGEDSEAVIPQGVKKIEASAFQNNKTMRSITIPESVTEIGAFAFQCSNIRQISIPKKVTVIQVNTFCNCPYLKTAEIPNGIMEIREGAFKNCHELKTIELPESVQEIGAKVFSCDLQNAPSKTIVIRNPDITMDKTCLAGCKKYTIYAPEGSLASQFAPSWTKPLQEYDKTSE